MKLKYNDKHSVRKPDVNTFRREKFNLWSYLSVEMLGIGEPGELEPPAKASIQNFLIVPFMLERLIFLGCVVCFDAFLYVVTFLPIRVLFSLMLFVNETFVLIFDGSLLTILKSIVFITKGVKQKKTREFHRTHVYDLMRGAMLVVGCIALMQINMSRLYHFIRGQSMIKLYVLTSMMEVMDKLLSSFGQDVFDGLHIETRHNPASLKLLGYFVVAMVYVMLHSGLHFLHVATLTVVINSADEALITVLILNNFSEMKSFVFKKFDSNNLFQLACSDITERFQITLFLSIIILVALAQAGLGWLEVLPKLLRVGFLMMAAECLIDSMKHAFINKFNGIDASVYLDFGYVLRGDILTNQKDKIILDHTYIVTRRMGLSQIPLGCVCIRYVMLALNASSVQSYFSKQSTSSLVVHTLAGFLVLLLVKIAIGVGLVMYASSVREMDANLLLFSPAPSSNAAALNHLVSPKKLKGQHAGGDPFAPEKIAAAGTTAALAAGGTAAASVKAGATNTVPAQGAAITVNAGAAISSATTADGDIPVESEDSVAKVLFAGGEMTESEKIQERIEFMEELSSIERYTVYKGRII